MKPSLPVLPKEVIAHALTEAFAEDLGTSGDITTNATIAEDTKAEGTISVRQPGVISGLAVAQAAFQFLDPNVSFDAKISDGHAVRNNAVAARVAGNARAILTAERVALNFLGRMSGIATLTRKYVDAISGTHAKIADTRKTTPGLRAFEKYAVRCGGGVNHRAGLFDAVLIKDNHIVSAGTLGRAIERARANTGHMIRIEVEVDTLDQLDEALEHEIDAVLLDNMTPTTLRAAVKRAAGKVITEASGGVTLGSVREIAETGIDLISVGALTHSAPVLDFGLDFELRKKPKS